MSSLQNPVAHILVRFDFFFFAVTLYVVNGTAPADEHLAHRGFARDVLDFTTAQAIAFREVFCGLLVQPADFALPDFRLDGSARIPEPDFEKESPLERRVEIPGEVRRRDEDAV